MSTTIEYCPIQKIYTTFSRTTYKCGVSCVVCDKRIFHNTPDDKLRGRVIADLTFGVLYSSLCPKILTFVYATPRLFKLGVKLKIFI